MTTRPHTLTRWASSASVTATGGTGGRPGVGPVTAGVFGVMSKSPAWTRSRAIGTHASTVRWYGQSSGSIDALQEGEPHRPPFSQVVRIEPQQLDLALVPAPVLLAVGVQQAERRRQRAVEVGGPRTAVGSAIS